MTTRTDIFGEVIPTMSEEEEKELAAFVATIEVKQTYLREEKAEKPKKLKIRPSMKPSDWDDCLN